MPQPRLTIQVLSAAHQSFLQGAYAGQPPTAVTQYPLYAQPPGLPPSTQGGPPPLAHPGFPNNGAIPSSLQLGHPATLPSAAATSVAGVPTFGSFAGLPAIPTHLYQSHEVESARARVNQTRNDAIEHHFGPPRTRRPRRKRGPAHPVPSLGPMPTISPAIVGMGTLPAAPTSLNLLLLLLPDVVSRCSGVLFNSSSLLTAFVRLAPTQRTRARACPSCSAQQQLCPTITSLRGRSVVGKYTAHSQFARHHSRLSTIFGRRRVALQVPRS